MFHVRGNSLTEKYLRRYTDIPALIYLLREQRITLLDPESWDDANDSHYMSLYREANHLKSVLALCFTQAGEQYHHWRVFAHGSGGVCITFRHSKLMEAVESVPGLRCESVTYMKLEEIRESTPNARQLPFLKRYPFQDEREFRMVWESKKKNMTAFDIPIPLSCIDRITLSPWLHEALSDHLKQILKTIEGCGGVKIIRSTLISNEQWKTLGESAVETARASHPRK